MGDCPTPGKSRFRSRAAAVRWHRRARIEHKARLYPYRCPSGAHWHLTHDRPGWNTIPLDVDAELHAIAQRSTARYSDTLLQAQGWTRGELVDAVHTRLRTKYRELRDTGRLRRGRDGQIHLTGESGHA